MSGRKVAGRAELSELLSRGRVVEVDGVPFRLVVPSAQQVSALRTRMEQFHNDHKGAVDSREPDLMAMREWGEIEADAIAATLHLDGEGGPCADSDLAGRLLTASGGSFSPLARAALAQCGIVPKKAEAAEGGGEGEAGGGAGEGAVEPDPF